MTEKSMNVDARAFVANKDALLRGFSEVFTDILMNTHMKIGGDFMVSAKNCRKSTDKKAA